MAKKSGLTKHSTKEDKLLEHQFPASAESLTWEEFSNDIYYQYGKDFIIDITMKKAKNKPNEMAMNFELKEGSNVGDEKHKINLTLEKLRTLESGSCYKMTSDVQTFDKINHFSLNYKENPDNATYVTGENQLISKLKIL